MNIPVPYQFYLEFPLDVQLLQDRIPKKFTCRFAQEEFESAQALDTFDNELRCSGRLLVTKQDQLLLFTANSPVPLIEDSPANWRFLHELPDGPLSDALHDVSDLRAFLPVSAIELQILELILLDDEEKTRARACIYSVRQGERIHCFGATQPLKGYTKGHRKLVAALHKQGARAREESFDFYGFLGAPENSYTSKPSVPIAPDAPVIETTRSIVSTYIQVARTNEEGILADYDTEFLHDYRVSLRKVRSVLSLFKGVFAVEDTVCLKQAFAAIMQRTNRLRDLDVYLLEEDLYFSMVPESMHEGLRDMFASFAKERRQELKKVNHMLQGESYQCQIKELAGQFTATDGIQAGPQSTEASLDFACQKIWKRYRKVCKIARSITAATPDETIHELRIQCKKLRYLMEFFSPLFPKKEIRHLIRALKGLQDNLGRFNDFSVQQLSLQEFLQKHAEQSNPKLKLAESIGALVTVLHQRQIEERRHIMKNFAHFDSVDIRTSFQTLFTQENL